jgi:hypothetical protein
MRQLSITALTALILPTADAIPNPIAALSIGIPLHRIPRIAINPFGKLHVDARQYGAAHHGSVVLTGHFLDLQDIMSFELTSNCAQ